MSNEKTEGTSSSATPPDRVVYAFAKNAREDVRFTHSHYKGRALIDIRAFYRTDSGELRPSPKGVSIARELLPELEKAVAALRALHTEVGPTVSEGETGAAVTPDWSREDTSLVGLLTQLYAIEGMCKAGSPLFKKFMFPFASRAPFQLSSVERPESVTLDIAENGAITVADDATVAELRAALSVTARAFDILRGRLAETEGAT